LDIILSLFRQPMEDHANVHYDQNKGSGYS